MLFSKTIPTSRGGACLKKLTNNTTALFENIEKKFSRDLQVILFSIIFENYKVA